MTQYTPTRYKFEVQTFVWDFLFRVVVISQVMLLTFTAMSDQLLGVSRHLKLDVLVPELAAAAVIFILQVAVMTITHGVVDNSNYRTKGRVVFGVAVGQFLCVLFGIVAFTHLMNPEIDSQIQIFYWVLAGGIFVWDLFWFVKYLSDVLFYDPAAEAA